MTLNSRPLECTDKTTAKFICLMVLLAHLLEYNVQRRHLKQWADVSETENISVLGKFTEYRCWTTISSSLFLSSFFSRKEPTLDPHSPSYILSGIKTFTIHMRQEWTYLKRAVNTLNFFSINTNMVNNLIVHKNLWQSNVSQTDCGGRCIFVGGRGF